MKFEVYTHIDGKIIGHSTIEMTEQELKERYGHRVHFNVLDGLINGKGEINKNTGAFIPKSGCIFSSKYGVAINFVKIEE